MYELTITRIKYPKNESTTYLYESLHNLSKEFLKWIEDRTIDKNTIIRIERYK